MKSHGLPLPPWARHRFSTRRERLPSSRESASAAFSGSSPAHSAVGEQWFKKIFRIGASICVPKIAPISSPPTKTRSES